MKVKQEIEEVMQKIAEDERILGVTVQGVFSQLRLTVSWLLY